MTLTSLSVSAPLTKEAPSPTAVNKVVALFEVYAKTSHANVLALWGKCIADHFSMESLSPAPADPSETAQTAKAIVAFFEAVAAHIVQKPWPTGPEGKPTHPGMVGFISVLDALSTRLEKSETLAHVLSQWNPDTLWTALDHTQKEQGDFLGKAGELWQNLPFYRWTAVLGVQAIVSDWMPTNNNYSDKMWYSTPLRMMPNPDAAVARLAAKVPWSFGSALEFYRDEDEEHVTQPMVKSIFSMDLTQAKPALSTNTLLELMYDHVRYQSYELGMQLLLEKHPDVYAAFHLQVSLHDDVYDATKYGPVCIQAWNQAIHGQTVDCLALPALGLEGP